MEVEIQYVNSSDTYKNILFQYRHTSVIPENVGNLKCSEKQIYISGLNQSGIFTKCK